MKQIVIIITMAYDDQVKIKTLRSGITSSSSSSCCPLQMSFVWEDLHIKMYTIFGNSHPIKYFLVSENPLEKQKIALVSALIRFMELKTRKEPLRYIEHMDTKDS